MSHGDGARDRILTAQDHRERAALSVHPIHHPKPSSERCDLPRALTLEPRDLAAIHLDVALRLLDARLQPRDLALLGRQTPIDLLELGQERRLARARRGGALLFFLELLLGLLQLALLGRQRIAALRLRGRGSHREHRQRDRERSAAHGSRPARASHPPRPPSKVPAPRSATTPRGVKKTSCESPSVRLT